MPAKFNTEISERIAVDTFGDYKIEFLDYQERCDTLGQAHMQHENAITYVMARE